MTQQLAVNKFTQMALKYGFSLWGLPKTGQVIVYTTNDDGTYKKGYPKSGARYTDNGDGTITDNATGLMWQKSSSSDDKSFASAISYCEALTLGGYNDWRLPNFIELLSIVEWQRTSPRFNPTFFLGIAEIHWSSTTSPYNIAQAFAINFSSNFIGVATKTDAAWIARAVRLGI